MNEGKNVRSRMSEDLREKVVEKKLEINEKINMHCYLWYALNLSILDPENNIFYKDWFYSHFINPVVYCYKNSSRVKLDYIEYFDDLNVFREVLNIDDCMPQNAVNSNIVEFFKECIKNRIYIEIEVDHYYLKYTSYYQNMHFTHPILLYGFGNVFFCAVSFNNNTYRTTNIGFREIVDAYESALRINSETGVMAYRLITKKEQCIRNYSAVDFYYQIANFCNGKVGLNSEKIVSLTDSEIPIKTGYQAYREVLGYMKNKLSSAYVDYRVLHFMYEQNMQIYKRLLYWKKAIEIDQNEISEYEESVNRCNMIRLIYLKREIKYANNCDSIYNHPEEFLFFVEEMEKILSRERAVAEKVCDKFM